MKILTGYIKPNEGTVFVDDIDVLKDAILAQKKIGYLPEHNPLYTEMYVREYLQFQAAIFKVDKSQIEVCIKKVGLSLEAGKKIHQLSKGYQQRVGLAAAILHNPEVLILDEPTTGLDPNQLVEIRELIKDLGKEKTVLFSTHIMQEVEAVCDRVIIIKKGQILVDKELAELNKNNLQTVTVTFNKAVNEALLTTLPNIATIENNTKNSWNLSFKTTEDMREQVFDFAVQNQLKILELSMQTKSLEALFREITN
jgi:ABC-2 type transport system ATP-binding protein